MSAHKLMKYWRNLILRLVGLLRFLSIMDYEEILDEKDREIVRILLNYCGFPLNKELLNKYLYHEPVIIEVDGSYFITLDLEDFYHATLCDECDTLRFIYKIFPKNGKFVDIGANIGGYTVRIGKIGEVYAFEPHPCNYKLLEINCKLNNVNAHLYQQAVGDRNGKTFLHISNFHGRHSIVTCHSDKK